MPGKSPYPAELRRRAVRMVAEVRPDYPTEWATINAVATKLGIGTAETLQSTAEVSIKFGAIHVDHASEDEYGKGEAS